MTGSIDDVIDSNVEGPDSLEFLTFNPLSKPIDQKSLIQSLHQDIERTRKKLELARQNHGKYAPVIEAYKARIAEKEARIRELEGSVAAGGSGGRPPRGGGIGGIDDYSQEKEALRNYFSSKDLKSVLKTEENWDQAAIAVRILSEIGIKLEDYEAKLPRNYKLEVLRRSGEFEYVFRDEPRFTRHFPREDKLFRVVSEDHFAESYLGMPGYYFEKSLKKYEDLFTKGVPCINRNRKTYRDYWAHIGNIRDDIREDLAGTESLFISTTTNPQEQMSSIGTEYIIEFKPRGLNIIDAKETLKEDTPLNAPTAFIEAERSIIGYIDPRDIISVSIYRSGSFVRKVQNPNFIRG